MYHARSLFFVIYFYVNFVNGTTTPRVDYQDHQDSLFYDKPCPDGLPGRVTQIQEQSLSRLGIFITDCSPSRNNTLPHSNPFEISALDKRQEQICPADCSNQCSGGSGGPTTSDCANLANQLNSRNTQFTVSGSQTISMTYGTCMFQLVNMVSSPFIYCDTNWASRSTGVVNSCLPQSSGGMCQGSRFQAVVAVNNLAPAPAPAPTTANNPATTNQGGSGNTGAATNANGANTSSGTNGGGTASNSNSASGNTASSNTVSLSVSSGALPTPLNGSQSEGSGSRTTTLSNGSVLVLPTVSFASGGSSETGNQQSSTSSANIPAIIGAVLGLVFLLVLVILLLLWRRKKQAQSQLATLEAETLPREFSMAQAISTDPRLHAMPALGLENGTDISEAPMTEAAVGSSVWATSNKARMYAEEAMPRTSDTDLSSMEPSTYTTPNALTDSPPAPVYQIQSSSSRRESERSRRGHRIGGSSGGGSRDHLHLRPQQTGNALSYRDRDPYASNSHSTLTGSSPNSMSARTFAEAAAPNLSAGDIDRLAESIVARMQGRDPALRGRITEEAGSSVITEDEPPPPWSAPPPGVNIRGL